MEFLMTNISRRLVVVGWAAALAGGCSAELAQDTQRITANPAVVGYYPAWSSSTTPLAPSAVPWSKLTHINIAFAGIDKNYHCAFWTSYQGADAPATEYDANVRALVSQRNSMGSPVKILLSVGGWSLSYRFSTTLTPAYVDAWVQSCVDLMQSYGLDGIDLDWEYPGRLGPGSGEDGSCPAGDTCQRPEDNQNLTAALGKIRQEYQRRYGSGGSRMLTAAVRANWTDGGSDCQNLSANPPLWYIPFCDDSNKVPYDYAGLAANLDYIQLMTYDLHGTWESSVDHLAPMWWMQRASEYAAIRGNVPKNKIVIGLPFYGPFWFNVAGEATGSSGTPGTQQLCNSLNVLPHQTARQSFLVSGCVERVSPPKLPGYAPLDGQPYTDDHNSYLWCPGTGSFACGTYSNLWTSYHSVADVQAKMSWAKSRGYGGGMFWMLTQDYQDELVSAMFGTLTGGGCTPSCGGKTCGSDGCGGSCGTCASGSTCSTSGQCVAGGPVSCGTAKPPPALCGPGSPRNCAGLGGWTPSVVYTQGQQVQSRGWAYEALHTNQSTPPTVSCWANYSISRWKVLGACTDCGVACQRSCGGKQCGPDGCGGSCGTCSSGSSCSASGQCVLPGGSGGDSTCSGATPPPASCAPGSPVTCGGLAAWSATTAYTGGAQVRQKGYAYQARWWTQGEDPQVVCGPDLSGIVWKAIGACSDCP
jgi:chitinase